MAEKITDEQVEALQKLLASDVAIESKVAQVTAVKTGIKHHNVPDTCVAPLFDALRTASRNQHAVLVNAGLTSLNHLLTRLSRQEPKYIYKEKGATLKLLVEKLGDQKEKFRALAVQSLVTMCKIADVKDDVEASLRKAMDPKNPKAKVKEASLQWLLQAHKEAGLPFKSYVSMLMDLLGDADPTVRETAKTTVIELFRDASPKAKADLNKELGGSKVRPATAQAILKELVPRGATSAVDTQPSAESTTSFVRPTLASSVSAPPAERPITPAPDARTETVDPSYINTARELEDMFREMHGYFEGNETEHNWKQREHSMNRLRRLLAGNAATDFWEPFLSGLRGLLDGIIKAVKSLRTSLSKEGCNLVQDIAITYGPGMDPMVELFMQTFVQLAAATKKIASQSANVCVDTIVGRVTCTKRLMEHIASACADKNVQPRTYATAWLKTVLQKEAHHKSHIEHIGGLELIEKSIKKGLADANPGVREKMRGTFWVFYGIWPARAEVILDNLDATARKLLEKDPNNPKASSMPAAAAAAARPGLGLSRSTMGTKPTLREAMKAQRAAMSRPGSAMEASRPRPGSAMEFSPPRAMRTVSGASNASGPSTTAPSTATRTKAAGLSGAPVRPVRRPAIPQRPKTAGPYDSRGGDEPVLASPPQIRKAMTPKTLVTSPKRTIPRVRPGHKPTTSESSIPSPTRLASPRSSPATSPLRSRLPGPLLPSSPKLANLPNISDVANSPSPIALPKLSAPIALVPTERRDEVTTPETTATGVSEDAAEPMQDVEPNPPSPSTLKVYEDASTTDASPLRPTAVAAVLEEKPVNEDAANLLARQNGNVADAGCDVSSDKARQQARLIDSALNKIKAKSLDVHGFRKFQGIIRDVKAPLGDEKFDALLLGLFDYLEDPQSEMAAGKVQDIKAQILATIKLLLKKHRDHFQPHISQALESLMAARAVYDARTHIVSGLELLADELVTLGDAQEIATVLTKRMTGMHASDAAGCRSLSMGLHVLKEMVDTKVDYVPTDDELGSMAALCMRCLDSNESGVRMDAVQLCVALHARTGDARFWDVMKDVRDDPKSLITYYIVKRQRENESASGTARA